MKMEKSGHFVCSVLLSVFTTKVEKRRISMITDPVGGVVHGKENALLKRCRDTTVVAINPHHIHSTRHAHASIHVHHTTRNRCTTKE